MALEPSVFHRWIRLCLALGGVAVCIVLILPAIEMNREAARRSASKNNLKQFGLALQNYHETYGCLPPGGTFDAAGRGYHGWGALLIPQLDSCPLSELIDYHQPWDSPFNSAFARKRIPIFQNPSIADLEGENEFGVAHYSANSYLLAANSAVKISEIENPASTFILGELGGDFVPWACPYNWRPLTGVTGPPHHYGRRNNIGGHFLMVDATVRWIDPQVSEEVLNALRGANLAEEASSGLKIVRPKSFPLPPDALRLDSVKFGEDLWGIGRRNRSEELVQLSISTDKLHHGGATDAVLRHLAEFQQLEMLRAEGDFTDDGLRAVAQLSTLKSLELHSSQITDDGLLALASLKALRHLTVSGKQISPKGLATLAERLPDCKVDR